MTEIEKFMNWLDTRVIADNVFEHLEEYGAKKTFENAKKVWLDFLLTELSEGLDNSVDALFEKGEL